MTANIHTNKTRTVLKRPRITEKAAILSEGGMYTFEVAPNATKTEIMAAVKKAYKVTPVSVNIMKSIRKNITRRGRAGVKVTSKKAVVHVKKGDKIEFI